MCHDRETQTGTDREAAVSALRHCSLQVWMKEARETDLVPAGRICPFHLPSRVSPKCTKLSTSERMQTKPEEIWQESLCVGLDASTHNTRVTFVKADADEVIFQIILPASKENPTSRHQINHKGRKVCASELNFSFLPF